MKLSQNDFATGFSPMEEWYMSAVPPAADPRLEQAARLTGELEAMRRELLALHTRYNQKRDELLRLQVGEA